jgi:hypothetical protein
VAECFLFERRREVEAEAGFIRLGEVATGESPICCSKGSRANGVLKEWDLSLNETMVDIHGAKVYLLQAVT